MNIKTIIKAAKIGITVVTIVPPVIDGAKVIINGTNKFVKNRIEKSESIQEIMKRYKLRSEEGIITVDYQEV